MKCPHCGRDSRDPVQSGNTQILTDLHQYILQYNVRWKQGVPSQLVYTRLSLRSPIHARQDIIYLMLRTQMLEVRDGAYWALDHDKND